MTTNYLKQWLGLLLLSMAFVLAGCSDDDNDYRPPATQPSGDGDGSGEEEPTNTGVFSDSPVAGIAYLTDPGGLEGTTNSLGEYDYREGDTVQFRVGGIDLPPVTAKGKVTPLDMGGENADLSTPEVINVIRLLQTLDEDGDPENGITVAAETATALADTSLDFSSNTFDSEAQVAADRIERDLVSEEEAIAHFEGSLKSDLLGSWVFEEEEGGINVLTFFGDNAYVIVHSESDDDEQSAGSGEFGTYSWDPVSGEFSVTKLIRESDGSGGLYNDGDVQASQGLTMTIADATLSLEFSDGTVEFKAVESAEEEIIGAWRLSEWDKPVNHNILTVLDESNYVIAHTYNEEAYGTEAAVAVSSEWNTYSWAEDNAFTIDTPSVDADGPGGLYDDGSQELTTPYVFTHGNGDLEFQFTENDRPTFARIGHFEVELIDLEGDVSSARIKRTGNRFVGDAAANYEVADLLAGEAGSYDIVRADSPIAVALNGDGTGSLTFSEFDVNAINWEVSSSGVLHFTEEDGSGDQWFWSITPIASKSTIAALVEGWTPEGQADSLDVAFIAPVPHSLKELPLSFTGEVVEAADGASFANGSSTLQCVVEPDLTVGNVEMWDETWGIDERPDDDSYVDGLSADYDPATRTLTASASHSQKSYLPPKARWSFTKRYPWTWKPRSTRRRKPL